MGESIQVSQGGIYWVDVTNSFGCSSRDSLTVTVNPLPVVLLGDDRHFCEGTSVTVDATAGFTSYEWSNGAAGTSITVTEPGIYWVLVTDQNGCIDSDSVELFMDPLPGETQVMDGDVSVNTYSTATSRYNCSVAANSESYLWTIDPVNSGVLEQNGTGCTVTWNTGFTGIASLNVISSNECGQGAISAAYQVTVYTTLSVDESGTLSSLNIFPNPTQGVFRVEFSSDKEVTIELQLSTTSGEVILKKQLPVRPGLFSEEISLAGQPYGVYNLTLRDGEKMVSKKIVYKR